MISLTCPCGKRLKIEPDKAGKRVRCPDCRVILNVPAVAEPEELVPDVETYEVEPAEDAPDDAPEERRRPRRSQGESSSKKTVIRMRGDHVQWALGLAAVMGVFALILMIAMAVRPRSEIAMLLVICVGGAAAGGGFAAYHMVRKARLILDDDFLQLRIGGGDVEGQIPLANVTSTAIAKRVDVWHDQYGRHEKVYHVLEILFLDQRHEDMWWPKLPRKRGVPLEIRDEYTKSLTWIHGRIKSRVEQIRDQRRHER